VVVQGGRAAGRWLPGSLRSLVGSFTDVSVVEVNPLTTLITDLRRQRPGLGFARASRAVKRYFGVPGWADLGQDLRNGPDRFNASAYVRDVVRYGSIDRLNRALGRGILRGRSHVRPPVFDAGLKAAAVGGARARVAVNYSRELTRLGSW